MRKSPRFPHFHYYNGMEAEPYPTASRNTSFTPASCDHFWLTEHLHLWGIFIFPPWNSWKYAGLIKEFANLATWLCLRRIYLYLGTPCVSTEFRFNAACVPEVFKNQLKCLKFELHNFNNKCPLFWCLSCALTIRSLVRNPVAAERMKSRTE